MAPTESTNLFTVSTDADSVILYLCGMDIEQKHAAVVAARGQPPATGTRRQPRVEGCLEMRRS
jgi:hypothetical protein